MQFRTVFLWILTTISCIVAEVANVNPKTCLKATKSVQISHESILHDDRFVCLNPNVGKYGGFGNLIFSAIAIHLVSLVTRRRAVYNHFLLLQLFDFPGTWHHANTTAIIQQQVQVGGISKCKDIQAVDVSQLPKYYGINGCYQSYFTNAASLSFLHNLVQNVSNFQDCKLPKAIILSHIIAEHTLNNVRPFWKAAAQKYREKLSNSTSTKPIHVAVQYRSWRDVYHPLKNADLLQDNFECHVQCTLKYLQVIQAYESRNLIIFISTDNTTVSELFAKAIHNANISNHFEIIVNTHYVENYESNNWHSANMVQQFRFDGDTVIDDTFLHFHQELLEWYLLGEAHYAVYTKGSTFAVTARMRKGLSGQLNDFVASTSSVKEQQTAKAKTVCACQPIFPHETVFSNMSFSQEMNS